MLKVISFCLWGDNLKYTIGAIRNAEIAKEIYPGWICRYYCGTSVPENILSSLRDLGSQVILMNELGNWTGMFWRFSAIADDDVSVMISRDTDSRLSYREKTAVDEWLAGDKLFHTMRDHPCHSTEILGGMWGARKPILQDINYLMKHYTKGDFWQVDQQFLKEVVWPRVTYATHTHDEFFSNNCKFPMKRDGLEFVGQVYDENDIPTKEFSDILNNYILKVNKVVQ